MDLPRFLLPTIPLDGPSAILPGQEDPRDAEIDQLRAALEIIAGGDGDAQTIARMALGRAY